MYYLSTKAHEGPQQPTKADTGPRRWKTAQTTERYVFFLLYILFFIFYITSRLHHTHHTPLWCGRKPTKAPAANEGRRRPTKREKGPNDARCVVWAIGRFFVKCIFSKCTTYPRKPTKAHSSQRRPTQAHEEGKGPKRCQTRRLGHR